MKSIDIRMVPLSRSSRRWRQWRPDWRGWDRVRAALRGARRRCLAWACWRRGAPCTGWECAARPVTNIRRMLYTEYTQARSAAAAAGQSTSIKLWSNNSHQTMSLQTQTRPTGLTPVVRVKHIAWSTHSQSQYVSTLTGIVLTTCASCGHQSWRLQRSKQGRFSSERYTKASFAFVDVLIKHYCKTLRS